MENVLKTMDLVIVSMKREHDLSREDREMTQACR